jgi:glycosyltransferase involved in cell wall biosynthesis
MRDVISPDGETDRDETRRGPSVAVLIPCYNEEIAIGKVVADFRAALSGAKVYVYDNNSTDATIAVAMAAGAICRSEALQGKGNVVRRMFADVEADVYVLVDGDDTYDAASAHRLIEPVLLDRVDMVNAVRRSEASEAYRKGHQFGNRMLTGIVALIFGNRFTDVLSGYRAMSRRFVKSFPALSRGFEIETELAVHALELRLPIAEIDTPYKERPPGSYSKLSTYRDGMRILRVIMMLMKEERPLQFFATAGGLCLLTALILAAPLLSTYLETGLVPRLPTAVLSSALTIVGLLLLMSGLILDTVTHGRRENKRMHYLAQPAPERREHSDGDESHSTLIGK